jgi:hypothetical protein
MTLGDECANCGCMLGSHEIAMTGKARVSCPSGRGTEWETKATPAPARVKTEGGKP